MLLYSLDKASYNMFTHIFDTWPSLVYRWIVDVVEKLPEQEIPSEIKDIEFGEMWHFIKKKKTSVGSSKLLTVARGNLWLGCSAVVILRHSNGFAIN